MHAAWSTAIGRPISSWLEGAGPLDSCAQRIAVVFESVCEVRRRCSRDRAAAPRGTVMDIVSAEEIFFPADEPSWRALPPCAAFYPEKAKTAGQFQLVQAACAADLRATRRHPPGSCAADSIGTPRGRVQVGTDSDRSIARRRDRRRRGRGHWYAARQELPPHPPPLENRARLTKLHDCHKPVPMERLPIFLQREECVATTAEQVLLIAGRSSSAA